MAANLVKAGNEVAVWNRTPGKNIEGARVAESPADAARDAEVVWMCVSDTKAVEAVLFGPQGVESTIGSGAIVVDSSTISPSAELQFAERLRAKGVEVTHTINPYNASAMKLKMVLAVSAANKSGATTAR